MSKASKVIEKLTEKDDFKYFEKGPKHIYYHYDKIDFFREGEIEKSNKKELEESAKAMLLIKADGFIEFPIFFRNVDGELVERSAWIHPTFEPSNSDGFKEKHGMNYNIYIPSYERYKQAMTIKMLQRFGVDNWYVAVDPTQYEKYKAEFGPEKIVIRDIFFKDEKMLDMATSIKSPNTMHGTAGIYNFLLSFSRSMGEEKYWTMDDDIMGMAMKAKKGDELMKAGEIYDKNNFYRCSNIKDEYGFSQSEFLCSMEELSKKMRNPGFVGLEKFGIVFSLPVMWKLGTRLYSFYLSDNNTQVNHFAGNNNDVVTSLEMSKRGFVNMLFEGISYNSGPTQADTGGLSSSYKFFGTLEKGKILVRAEPNFSKISINYNRIHHVVDYNVYNKQRIVGAPIPTSDD